MAYNTKPKITDNRRVTATSAIKTKPDGQLRFKSDLFLLAVAGMANEKTFYESAKARESRFAVLVRELAVKHPKWTARFLAWLRGDGNMRSASIVGAAHYVHARLAAGEYGGNRQVVESVIQRADEPGEMLAYWTSTFGRNVPISVKRGIADAVISLGTEFNYLKWDSEGHGYRWRDILNLTHPGDRKRSRQEIRGDWQHALFENVVKSSYVKNFPVHSSLEMLQARDWLMSIDVDERRRVIEGNPEVLSEAGMTWEALAGWLQGPMDARAWEAVIPNMGYMGLLRNLRNFDQAGVSDAVAARVAQKLADPAQVAKSRQFPMRFLSAYRAAESLRWAWPLEQALDLSLNNIPELDGSTLIMIDTSYSMNDPLSEKSELKRWDAAVLFGNALARRCAHANVVSFSAETYHDGIHYPLSKEFHLKAGESLLKTVARWDADGFNIGANTNTAGALRKHYGVHSRVVILTDDQYNEGGDPSEAIPSTIPLYTWNLAGYGYRAGHAKQGTALRHTFAGLSDAGLRMIPLLEAGRSGGWPF